MRKSKGFTLIELLVVIAIIGILAAIVLVSLGSARTKAKDSAIKANMTQIRTAAEDFNLSQTSATYVGMCGANTNCATLKTGISNQGGQTALNYENTNGQAYCVTVPLNNITPDPAWCVDSTGYVGAPATTATCIAGCVAANTCKCK